MYAGSMTEELINPFRNLRLRARMTLGELATYSNIDIRALNRSEHGLYTNPLPALVAFWVNKGVISEGTLVTEYEDFQVAVRHHNHRCLGPNLSFHTYSNIHPLRQLRAANHFKLLEFCKALCLPLDTVQYFEKKWRVQKSIPKGLMLALNQAGYRQGELDSFKENYAHWRSTQNTITFS